MSGALSYGVKTLVCLWLSVLFIAEVGNAQSISGIVYDPTGGVVAGARVMLMRDYVKLSETKSSAAGEFSFAGLMPGMYQLQIKQPVFSLYQSTVIVEADKPVQVYAVLPLVRVYEALQINSELAPGTRKALAAPSSRAGGNVEPPEPLRMPRPAYPPAAASRGVEGDVALFATLLSDGSLGDIVVLKSPDPALSAEAIRALKNCHYRPLKLNGSPTETKMTFVFNFRLQ